MPNNPSRGGGSCPTRGRSGRFARWRSRSRSVGSEKPGSIACQPFETLRSIAVGRTSIAEIPVALAKSRPPTNSSLTVDPRSSRSPMARKRRVPTSTVLVHLPSPPSSEVCHGVAIRTPPVTGLRRVAKYSKRPASKPTPSGASIAASKSWRDTVISHSGFTGASSILRTPPMLPPLNPSCNPDHLLSWGALKMPYLINEPGPFTTEKELVACLGRMPASGAPSLCASTIAHADLREIRGGSPPFGDVRERICGLFVGRSSCLRAKCLKRLASPAGFEPASPP